MYINHILPPVDAEIQDFSPFIHFAPALLVEPPVTTYAVKHDMYAVGIMMFEFATQRKLFIDNLDDCCCQLKDLPPVATRIINDGNNCIAKQMTYSEQGWIKMVLDCLNLKIQDAFDDRIHEFALHIQNSS